MSEQSSIQSALSKISKDAFERQSALERQRMRLAKHAPKVAEEIYPLFKAYVQAMNEMPGDKSRLAIKDDRLLILRRGVFYRHLQNTAIGVQASLRKRPIPESTPFSRNASRYIS